MPDLRLPWQLRCRIAAIQALSYVLRVPIVVQDDTMREYKVAEVLEYVEDCDKLFGPIFDVEKLEEFHAWVVPFLTDPAVIDNPFNLYDHPLETTAQFFNIRHVPGDDHAIAEMEALWKRYRETGLKLAWYD